MTYHPYGAPPPFLPPPARAKTGMPTGAVVAALIVLPPLGIAMMWLRGGPASVKRIVATVLASVWTLLLFLAVLGAAVGPTPTPPRPINLVADTSSAQPPATTSPAGSSAFPTATASKTTAPPSPTTTAPAVPATTVAAPPTATPSTAAPAPMPVPATTAPAAPPPPTSAPAGGIGPVVHPGAFCSPEGATGVTDRGTPMVCGPGSDGRNRWHKA